MPYMVRVAHPTTGSAASRRYRHTRAVAKTARASPHNRIDPARADHNPVIEYSRGVTRALLAAT